MLSGLSGRKRGRKHRRALLLAGSGVGGLARGMRWCPDVPRPPSCDAGFVLALARRCLHLSGGNGIGAHDPRFTKPFSTLRGYPLSTPSLTPSISAPVIAPQCFGLPALLSLHHAIPSISALRFPLHSALAASPRTSGLYDRQSPRCPTTK